MFRLGFIVALLTAGATVPAAAQSGRPLLHDKVSIDVPEIIVTDMGNRLFVSLHGATWTDGSLERPSSVRSLSSLNICVWALRRDGTALKRIAEFDTPRVGSIETAVSTQASEMMTLRFDTGHTAANELTAVVVEAEGKLSVFPLIGLVAQASERVGALAQSSQPVDLLTERLSDDALLQVSSQSAALLVSITGPYWHGIEHPPSITALKERRIQAWLLKSDGTAVNQGANRILSFSNAGSTAESDMTVFAPVPASELVGVVVSLDGKLYVREMNAKP